MNPDIIAISEMWLHETQLNATLGLSEYEVSRKDRRSDVHGGVVLAVKPSINPTLENNDTDHEIVLANLMIRN